MDIKLTREQLEQELQIARKRIFELETMEDCAGAVAALRKSEERFRSLFDNMSSGCSVWHRDGDGFTLVNYNKAGEIMDSIDKQDLIGKTVNELFPDPAKKLEINKIFENVWSSGQSVLIPATSYEIGDREVWRENFIYRLAGGEIVVVFTDITDRKLAEEALQQSEAKFRGLIESSSDWIWEVDTDGIYTYASPQVEAILGYTPAEVIGRSLFDFLQPEDIPRVAGILEERARTGEPTMALEKEILHKDNHPVVIETTGVPVLDESGQIIGFRGVNRDITERKRAEKSRKALERQVQHAQKLKSLGILAGGIAHDFNNLLMAILGNADLALHEISPMSPARLCLLEIEKASKRAADLAKQMLAYSGKGRYVVEMIDAEELVKEIAHLLRVSVSKKAVLRYDFTDNLPTFEGDATQIRQVVMNLITNASEAIGDRSGLITLSTGVMNCDRSYLDDTNEILLASLDGPLEAGRYIYIEVTDTGSGMDTATIEKIFDPFFTTKFTGRGLGMSAVLGIMRGHNGALKVYSEPGKGTSFKILFPIDEQIDMDSSENKGIATLENAWSKNGTILIADDELTIRNVGQRMLEYLGFKVLAATDGKQALDLFEAHQDEIVCTLLDLTMPHMDGEEAFRKMRRINPSIVVILCSGYNELDATEHFAGKGLAGFIQKPYSLETLREKLSVALAGE